MENQIDVLTKTFTLKGVLNQAFTKNLKHCTYVMFHRSSIDSKFVTLNIKSTFEYLLPFSLTSVFELKINHFEDIENALYMLYLNSIAIHNQEVRSKTSSLLNPNFSPVPQYPLYIKEDISDLINPKYPYTIAS